MPDNANGYEKITIQGHPFDVPIRYAPGHTLTEAESTALNQLYHSNLRNNFAKKVKATDQSAPLTPEGLKALQDQLDTFAANYQFGARAGKPVSSSAGVRNPVMTLALNMARDTVRKAIKDRDLSEADWPPTAVTVAAKALLDHQGEGGDLITTARRHIEAERESAKHAMDTVYEILESSKQTSPASPGTA
jgi:hypothetical protein